MAMARYFQSTLPRGERRKWGGIPSGLTQFQSTLPQGERLSYWICVSASFYFNPRSREGSDPVLTAPGWRKSDFNPRSREGSDFLQPVRRLYCKISIHAPARGATGGSETAGNTVSIFQSTLPRGKRLRLTRKQIYSIFISIHAPARGATIFAPATEPAAFISIHAPARGATQLRRRRKRSAGHFNPRSREGSDLVRSGSGCPRSYFNPRSREGSDLWLRA